jgi:transposase-like protein
MRWVQRFVPEFERRWNLFSRQSGESWRVDVKIRGVWTCLYRAVDRDGKTVDFGLSPRRDVAAAKSFFRKALKTQGRPPRVITLEGYAAPIALSANCRRRLDFERHQAEVIEISQ